METIGALLWLKDCLTAKHVIHAFSHILALDQRQEVGESRDMVLKTLLKRLILINLIHYDLWVHDLPPFY